MRLLWLNIRAAWNGWRSGKTLIIFDESVRSLINVRDSLRVEIANMEWRLLNENRQINEQMNRVMLHNKEIVKAFRSKMTRRQRGQARNDLRQQIAHLEEERAFLLQQARGEAVSNTP